MSAPRVSVIVPSYKTASFIGETLDSVFAQDYPNYEIIVVNDGSPDTPDLERELERFKDRITYIKKPNGGVASARNAGIQASTGDYIALLDSDDLMEPNWMRVQVKYLKDHPDVDCVYGDGIMFGNGISPLRISEAFPSTGSVTFESLVGQQCSVSTVGIIIPRQVIFSVGLLDETLRWGEDFDLWLRIVKAGYRITYHREVIFRYRRHPGGVSLEPATLPKYAVTVMGKMLRRDDLTPGERSAAEAAKLRFDSIILLHEGKVAFELMDFTTAAEKISLANVTLRQFRLSVATTLLRLCPRVVWHARRVLARSQAAGA